MARRRLELLSAELATRGRRRPRPGRPPARRRRPGDRGPAERRRGAGGRRVGGGARCRGGTPVDPWARWPAVGGWVHDRLPPTAAGAGGGSARPAVVALLSAPRSALRVVVGRAPTGRAGPGARDPRRRPGELAVVTRRRSRRPGSLTSPPPGPPPPRERARGRAGRRRGRGRRRPGAPAGHRHGCRSGSRVVDALEAAGGARRGVDLSALNLARLLVDGEQVVVGVRPAAGVAAPAASAPGASSAAAAGQHQHRDGRRSSRPCPGWAR